VTDQRKTAFDFKLDGTEDPAEISGKLNKMICEIVAEVADATGLDPCAATGATILSLFQMMTTNGHRKCALDLASKTVFAGLGLEEDGTIQQTEH
jgi:hypothetical protein